MSIKHMLLRITLFLILLSLFASTLNAQPLQACIGYNPETQLWGVNLKRPEFFCPKNYAFYGSHKPTGDVKAHAVAALGNCCPLPYKDILTAEHLFDDSQCPSNFVATGIRILPENIGDHYLRTIQLRCTKINISRYELSKPRAGALWGLDSSSGGYFWKEKKVLKLSDLPPALQIGLRRRDYNAFADSGCVGQPFGALLVAKKSKRCKDFYYVELLEKTKKGVQKVKMYPDCRYVADPFSANTKCVE